MADDPGPRQETSFRPPRAGPYGRLLYPPHRHEGEAVVSGRRGDRPAALLRGVARIVSATSGCDYRRPGAAALIGRSGPAGEVRVRRSSTGVEPAS